MIKAILAVVVLVAGLMVWTGTARADAYLYVGEGIHLNARIGPGTRYRIHDVLAPGTRVEIVTRVGNWANVRTPEGLMLWVYFAYLSTQPPHQILRPAPPIFLAPPPRWYTPRSRVRPQPYVQPHPRVEPTRPVKPKVQRPAKPKVQNPVKPKVQHPVKPKVQRPAKPKVQRPVKPKVQPKVQRPAKPKVQRPTQSKRQPTQRQRQSNDPNEARRDIHRGR